MARGLRLFVFVLLTVGAAASIGWMFAQEGAFVPVWTYATLALYGAALLLMWLVLQGRDRKESEDEPAAEGDADATAERVAQALAARSAPKEITAPSMEPELVVEPSRTEPIVVPTAPAAPAAYKTRGFTLYERPGKKGPSRFFSKAKPPGAQPIALPDGFSVTWNKKQKKPELVEPVTAASVLAEPEPEVAVEQAAHRACAAMIAPGEFCENDAKGGAKYCAKHASYRGPEDFLEVKKDSGQQAKGRLGKGFSSQFEVRVAKPVPKPIKYSSRPSAPNIVVKMGTSSAKPMKLAQPAPTPAFRPTTRPSARKAGKGKVDDGFEAHWGAPGGKPAKPLKIKPGAEPVVRFGSRTPPAPAKPLKIKPGPEPVVRFGSRTPPAPVKPLKIKPGPEPVVRFGSRTPPAPVKPLKIKPGPEPVVRFGSRTPAAPAKPLKITPGPEPEVRQGSRTPSAAPRPFKPKPGAEPQVRHDKGAPAKAKGKALAPSEIVVRKPGDGKSAKPVRFTPPEIEVVKDTKRRSTVGVSGAKARAK